MAIDSLSASKAYLDVARQLQGKGLGVAGGDGVEFGALVQDVLKGAQEAAAGAERAGLAAATGRADIVDVVTAIAAAETQLETVIAVRDQVIQAYQEILRMPI